MELIRNFHGKKGSPEFFCGLKGARKNVRDKYFLHQAPLTSVCEQVLIIFYLFHLTQRTSAFIFNFSLIIKEKMTENHN